VLLVALWPKIKLGTRSKRHICRNNFIQSPPQLWVTIFAALEMRAWLFVAFYVLQFRATHSYRQHLLTIDEEDVNAE
jgi:hypothetical protein